MTHQKHIHNTGTVSQVIALPKKFSTSCYTIDLQCFTIYGSLWIPAFHWQCPGSTQSSLTSHPSCCDKRSEQWAEESIEATSKKQGSYRSFTVEKAQVVGGRDGLLQTWKGKYLGEIICKRKVRGCGNAQAHTKISSMGFLATYTKICTYQNFPLYYGIINTTLFSVSLVTS